MSADTTARTETAGETVTTPQSPHPGGLVTVPAAPIAWAHYSDAGTLFSLSPVRSVQNDRPLYREGVDAHPLKVANCCQCGRIIDTREKHEGGDGHGAELSDGRWTCSFDCWEAVVDPLPVTDAGMREDQIDILRGELGAAMDVSEDGTAFDDPNFEHYVERVLRAVLPFTRFADDPLAAALSSEVHPEQGVEPCTPEDEDAIRRKYECDEWQLCRSNPPRAAHRTKPSDWARDMQRIYAALQDFGAVLDADDSSHGSTLVAAYAACERIRAVIAACVAEGRVAQELRPLRPDKPAGEQAEQYRSARGPEWCRIFDTLRDYRMSNMSCDDGDPGYPLVDLMTRNGDGITVADGEWEMLLLADEISLALAPAKAPEGEAPEVIGETYDGVKVLAPAVPSSRFTAEEARQAVTAALAPSEKHKEAGEP